MIIRNGDIMNSLAENSKEKEQPIKTAPWLKRFSIISFIIAVINMGFFSWFVRMYIIAMKLNWNTTTKTIIFCLILFCALLGIILGPLSLQKGIKWLAIIGTALNTTGTIWLIWSFIIYIKFYYFY
jgi:hypothetical protein